MLLYLCISLNSELSACNYCYDHNHSEPALVCSGLEGTELLFWGWSLHLQCCCCMQPPLPVGLGDTSKGSHQGFEVRNCAPAMAQLKNGVLLKCWRFCPETFLPLKFSTLRIADGTVISQALLRDVCNENVSQVIAGAEMLGGTLQPYCGWENQHVAAECWWPAKSSPQLMAGKRCSHHPFLDGTSKTTQSNLSAFGIKLVPQSWAKFKICDFYAGCFSVSLWRGYSQHVSSGRKPAACNSKMGIFLPGAQIRCLFRSL